MEVSNFGVVNYNLKFVITYLSVRK